mgnify:CR=1 FL=1
MSKNDYVVRKVIFIKKQEKRSKRNEKNVDKNQVGMLGSIPATFISVHASVESNQWRNA